MRIFFFLHWAGQFAGLDFVAHGQRFTGCRRYLGNTSMNISGKQVDVPTPVFVVLVRAWSKGGLGILGLV